LYRQTSPDFLSEIARRSRPESGRRAARLTFGARRAPEVSRAREAMGGTKFTFALADALKKRGPVVRILPKAFYKGGRAATVAAHHILLGRRPTVFKSFGS